MKSKIEKYNEWINRNIFYVTSLFAFWIAVAVSAIFYNIWLENAQTETIERHRERVLQNHEIIIGNDAKQDSVSQSLREKLDSINNNIN